MSGGKYIVGKSSLLDNVNPQDLLDGVHSGKYSIVRLEKRNGHPVVDFGRPIGIDFRTGKVTSYGTVHSSNTGAHIVPDANLKD